MFTSVIRWRNRQQGHFLRSSALHFRKRRIVPIIASFKVSVPEDDDPKAVDDGRIDSRVWPIAFSTFITGSAIGVALPVMPLFAEQMGLSTAEFGLVGSVFGGTRLLSNFPLAILTEKFGRRPFLTLGPALTGISMIGTGLSTTLPTLLGCRVITGLGGAAQMTGAGLYLADISRPSNRARTLAPMTAAFSAGASFGPAIGGFLAQTYGLAPCFFYVGGAIGTVGALNWLLIPETKPPMSAEKNTSDDYKVLKNTLHTWRRLSTNTTVQCILATHLCYWGTISGSQFTLMPIMASQELQMSAGAIGSIYAMVSVINVIGSQVSAAISDRFGRKVTIVPGTVMMSVAVAGLPLASNGTELTAIMALWAIGGAAVSMGPTAFITDLVPEEDRAQALSMLRSFGDLGLLIGAGSLGALADASNMELAFEVNAFFLSAVTLNMALRATEQPRPSISSKPPSDVNHMNDKGKAVSPCSSKEASPKGD